MTFAVGSRWLRLYRRFDCGRCGCRSGRLCALCGRLRLLLEKNARGDWPGRSLRSIRRRLCDGFGTSGDGFDRLARIRRGRFGDSRGRCGFFLRSSRGARGVFDDHDPARRCRFLLRKILVANLVGQLF
jgi:hypothetical protein